MSESSKIAPGATLSRNVELLADSAPTSRSGELSKLLLAICQDGITPAELSEARSLVKALQADAPDMQSYATLITNFLDGSADRQLLRIDLAQQILTAVEAQASADARMTGALPALPAGRFDYAAHYRGAMRTLLAQGFFTQPAPLTVQWSALATAGMEKLDSGQSTLRALPSAERGAIRSDMRAAARAWTNSGAGDAYLADIRAFGATVAAQFPAGDPRRAEALAAAYTAMSDSLFVHIAATGAGANIEYDRSGFDGPSFGALFLIQHSDDRNVVDCEGFRVVANAFFRAAGATYDGYDVRAVASAHAMGVATIDGRAIATSNEGAALIPSGDQQTTNAALLDYALQQVRVRYTLVLHHE
jgi:hypothetical protein